MLDCILAVEKMAKHSLVVGDNGEFVGRAMMSQGKQNSMMRAIAINGSLHCDGEVAKRLKRVDIPILHLRNGISKAERAIYKADIVLFATSVLWFNVSSLMKQLLEALDDGPPYRCEGKKAYLLAVGNEDGGQQAVSQMFGPLSHMGFAFPPWASQFVNIKMKGKSERRWQDKAPEFLRNEIRALLSKEAQL